MGRGIKDLEKENTILRKAVKEPDKQLKELADLKEAIRLVLCGIYRDDNVLYRFDSIVVPTKELRKCFILVGLMTAQEEDK